MRWLSLQGRRGDSRFYDLITQNMMNDQGSVIIELPFYAKTVDQTAV